MELKETKNLPTSVKVDVAPLSERNNSNDNNNRLYDVLFPSQDDISGQNIEDISSIKDYEKATFGSVSTLDWLKTWRSLETNQISSPEPGK